MPSIIGWIVTLFFVNIFWIFFRAKDLSVAFKVLKSMFVINEKALELTVIYKNALNNDLGNKIILIILLISIVLSIVCKNSYYKLKIFNFSKIKFIENLFYLFSSIILLNRLASFLYFNF